MLALVIQTAFAGDVILTTPLFDALHVHVGAEIDVVCIPGTAELLRGHPALRRVIPYNKHGGDSLFSLGRQLNHGGYDVCLSPHRSLRSALLARMSSARIRISYDRSAGRMLYTHTVAYDPTAHEVERCLDLLGPLQVDGRAVGSGPSLHPSDDDHVTAQRLLEPIGRRMPYICIAPGSVWVTKRWTEEGFIAVGTSMAQDHAIVLMGGGGDRELCARIAAGIRAEAGPDARILSLAGDLSFLASAAVLERAVALISNDSAPVHLASAMGTPVIEIFGATIPSFGFTPYGVPHETVDIGELPCRPCGIHGGSRCPIDTFVCMRELPPERIVDATRRIVMRAAASAPQSETGK